MADMSMNVQNRTERLRHVLILGFDDVLLMDVAGPAQVFGSANKVLEWSAYKIATVTKDSADFTTDTGLKMRADRSLDTIGETDDLIIPGGPGVDPQLGRSELQSFLSMIEPETERFVSVCSGSLLTASAGLLDGRKATTHWARTEIALRRFPNVEWHIDEIFTQDGKFHCSAGVTTGIDLALSLVEDDHGRRVALDVAREMVVFMQRQGGQSQYSAPLRAQSTTSKRLSDLYSRIEADPTKPWSVPEMAKIAGTTQRTLHRDFRHEFSQSPSEFVAERRLAIARRYLENTRKPLKEIASLSGFVSEQKMRRSFLKQLGVVPSAYRERFGTRDTPTR